MKLKIKKLTPSAELPTRVPTVAIVTGAVYRGREPEFVRLTDETKERYCASRCIRYVRRGDDVHPDILKDTTVIVNGKEVEE